jgi:hypothetical protein
MYWDYKHEMWAILKAVLYSTLHTGTGAWAEQCTARQIISSAAGHRQGLADIEGQGHHSMSESGTHTPTSLNFIGQHRQHRV